MNYGKMKATADRLLEQSGMPVVLSRYESAGNWIKDYDPVEGCDRWTNSTTEEVTYTAPASTPTEYTGYGVRTQFNINEIDGTNIRRDDIRLVLSTSQANGSAMPEPQEGDKFTMDGATYNYVSHERKAPATTDLVYIVQVRL